MQARETLAAYRADSLGCPEYSSRLSTPPSPDEPLTTSPIEPTTEAHDAASHLEPVAIPPEPIHWQGAIPFFLMHLGVFAIAWVGWSPVAVWTCVALYVLRMFAITGFYHQIGRAHV